MRPATRRGGCTGPRPGAIRFPSPSGAPLPPSVHQGDQDGVKGLYPINAVDCVTQLEIVATCEPLNEAYLLPVLEALLDNFPFKILGFHADNGSEYINYTVANLLEKLRVELTKSRPQPSNDNGLAETKNGAIVCKHLGYSHIPQRYASEVNAFCQEFLNPKEKTRKRYLLKNMMTSYEKLKSLPNAKRFLKPGVTFKQLDQTAQGHQR